MLKGALLICLRRSFFVFLAVLWGLPVGASSVEVVEGEYLVRFKPAAVHKVQQKLRGKGFLKAAFAGKNTFHLSNTQRDLVQELQSDPDVLYIEPNYRLKTIEPVEMSSILSQPRYIQSYAPIRATDAWAASSSLDDNPERPIVAVLDTGLDKNHRVFVDSGALWVNPREIPNNGIDDDFNGYVDDVHGWNFVRHSANFADDQGHGTHVSGIVLGATQDFYASTLEPAKIQIMPLKFLDKDGSGTTSSAVNAIYYAVDMGAKVINCSWGGGAYSRALHDALTHAYERGVLIVSAAGNDFKNNDLAPMYPASYDVPSNLSVVATTDHDRLASFSNFGSKTTHLGAPGVQIFSTMPDSWYAEMSGTSMATPLVAGAAALALREAPSLTGYQLRSLVMGSVDPVAGLAGKTASQGRINMQRMLTQAKDNISVFAYQPDYNPVYLAERRVATETTAGGGCGLIKATGAGLPPGGGSGLVWLLLLAPLALWMLFRFRAPQFQRRHDRYVLNSNLVIKAGEREIVASLKTISVGGLSFNLDEALERGGSLQMKVLGPDGETAIEVEGRIVWNERNQAYGVAFESVREQARSAILSWSRGLTKA